MNLVFNFLKPRSELVFLDQVMCYGVEWTIGTDVRFSASTIFIVYQTEFLVSTLIDYRQAEKLRLYQNIFHPILLL